MAGKQFSFFLGLTDQVAIEEAIRASGDVVFLADRSHSEVGEQLPSSIMLDPKNESFAIIIARRADLPSICFHPTHSPDKDFACNVTFQPIVEFDRIFAPKRFIRAGRFYRQDKFWNEDRELVSKSPDFILWADELYKQVKKTLTKVEQGCFAGPEALAMRRSGIPFEGLDIEYGSIED